MKKNILSITKKAAVLTLIGVLGLTSFTACGSSSDSKSEGDVKKIVVGLPNTFENIGYLDENGTLVGYEVDLLHLIDEKLEDYEFEYQQSTFDNILISLDAGKIDLGSHEFEYSEERAKKYLFGQEGYRDFSIYIVSLKGSGYTTLKSLEGQIVGEISTTDNTALTIEKYNKETAATPIKMDYYGEVGDDVLVTSLKENRWAATFQLLNGYDDWVREYGDIFELGDAVNQSEAYFLYPKDGEHEELRDAVDGAIKEIKESGQLDELAQKWFGYNAYPDN